MVNTQRENNTRASLPWWWCCCCDHDDDNDLSTLFREKVRRIFRYFTLVFLSLVWAFFTIFINKPGGAATRQENACDVNANTIPSYIWWSKVSQQQQYYDAVFTFYKMNSILMHVVRRVCMCLVFLHGCINIHLASKR